MGSSFGEGAYCKGQRARFRAPPPAPYTNIIGYLHDFTDAPSPVPPPQPEHDVGCRRVGLSHYDPAASQGDLSPRETDGPRQPSHPHARPAGIDRRRHYRPAFITQVGNPNLKETFTATRLPPAGLPDEAG